ncbi:hypothetical protein ACJMK2_035412 [Sinanodonta woodiana]|uniref:Radical S-adenosyl methionine domain-containing protein 1, mitochondrial n=1 Tax=Sinanodonta woodiana TaxID=1069815 RepID=A0ABD3WYV9_SINWO
MGTGIISRRVYLSSFSWNTLGFSVAANILLPWKSHFGQLLTRTVHQEVNVIESKTPETDDQAVLYVHWPYCAKRCTYCNFNKYVSESVDHERMAQCLETETRTLLKLSGVKQINSIFFGGGTPSLALPSTIERVINTVRDKVTFKPGSEVTLEANPTKLETERLRDFKTVGVNRVSIGVQALNQNHLNLLGREHTVEQSISCVKKAGALFPGRVSVDVIFGRPKQTLEDWRIELHRVLSFCDDHISLYQLTLEAGTPLYRWVKEKQCELPDSDTMADLYSEAIQILGDHGFERYEVSNFARNGAQCSHNWAYWRGMQYIGVGPGAHGRFSIQDGGGPREARIQTPLPDTWMTEVENRGHGTRKSEPLSNQQRLEEMVILGLRTIEGIPSSRWNRLSRNQDLISVFGNSEKVRNMVENNLLYLDESGLRASSHGLMVLDSIIPHLLNVLEKNITVK